MFFVLCYTFVCFLHRICFVGLIIYHYCCLREKLYIYVLNMERLGLTEDDKYFGRQVKY